MTRVAAPSVSRRTRAAVAGLVWTAVGAMLVSWAVGWLSGTELAYAVGFGDAGVALAILGWRLLFRRIAGKNLERLAGSPERRCVFGFQSWQSYAITVSMIALGVALRHSPIPKPELAVAYLAVGGALLLSSFRYHARLALHTKGAGL